MDIQFSSRDHKLLNINSTTIETGSPVYLNVYDLAKVNCILQFLGFGFFHTTVEVNEYEFSFGSTNVDTCGVFYNKMSEQPTDLHLKEKIFIGFTLLSQSQITQLLLLYLPFWLGKSYDPFTKNCNHFTKFLANKLLLEKASYPEYVNRVCQYGILFAGFYSPMKRLYGDIAYRSDNRTIVQPQENTNDKKEVYFPVNLQQQSNNNNLPDNPTETSTFIPDDYFFEGLFRVNQFLRVKEYNSTNRFLISLGQAETALIAFNDYDQALETLSELLAFVLSSNRRSLHNILITFNEKNTLYKYNYHLTGLKSIKALLLIKIYHLLHYIYVKKDNYVKQEEMINNICALYDNDYYAFFDRAYLKYKQNKLPECFEIVKHVIKNCENDDYRLLMKRFEKIIEDAFKENLG